MADSITDIRGQKIKELVEEMKLYNNPQELEDMKKLMKKNVPFAMRGYLMAYLYVTRANAQAKPKAERPDRGNRPERAERTEKAEKAVEKSDKPQQPKPALENATSFYVNVGKVSKGSARELVDFICEVSGLTSDDIVSVAYKQNYSFVYIKNDKIDGVIEKVTGQSYKGRKVKMNFSKEKETAAEPEKQD